VAQGPMVGSIVTGKREGGGEFFYASGVNGKKKGGRGHGVRPSRSSVTRVRQQGEEKKRGGKKKEKQKGIGPRKRVFPATTGPGATNERRQATRNEGRGERNTTNPLYLRKKKKREREIATNNPRLLFKTTHSDKKEKK